MLNNLVNKIDEDCNRNPGIYMKGYVKMLHDIWKTLMQNENYPPIPSTQWSYIGFQTNNPFTELAGLGIYALKCLHCLVCGVWQDDVHIMICQRKTVVKSLYYLTNDFYMIFVKVCCFIKGLLKKDEFFGYFAAANFSTSFVSPEHIYILTGKVFIIFCLYVKHFEQNNSRDFYSAMICVFERIKVELYNGNLATS